jgi:hypothetical protein
MIALAAFCTTAYAGFAGSPVWIILLSSLTLVLSITTSEMRMSGMSLVTVRTLLADNAPWCLFVGSGAYCCGLLLRLSMGGLL